MFRPDLTTRTAFGRRNLSWVLARPSSSLVIQRFRTGAHHYHRPAFSQVLRPHRSTSRRSSVASLHLSTKPAPLAQFESAVQDGNALYALQAWKEVEGLPELASSVSGLKFRPLCRNLAKLGKLQDKRWEEVESFLMWIAGSTPRGWASLHAWLDASLRERDFERIIRLWDSFCDQRKHNRDPENLSREIDHILFLRAVVTSYALMEPARAFKPVLEKLLKQTWVTAHRPIHESKGFMGWSPFGVIPINLVPKAVKWNDQVRFAQLPSPWTHKMVLWFSSLMRANNSIDFLQSLWDEYRDACSPTSDTRWIENVVADPDPPLDPKETPVAPSGLPDAVVHIRLLGSCLNSFLVHGRLEKVAEVWSLAKSFDLDRTPHLWHETLDAYRYRGDLNSIQRTLLEMKNEGIEPDARALSYLVRALLELGHHQEGIRWLERVMNMPEVINPDRYPLSPIRRYSTFVTMIVNGLLSLDLLPAVNLFLKRAIDLNIVVGPKPFLAILRHHCHRPGGPNRDAIAKTMHQMETWKIEPTLDIFYIFISSAKTHQDKLFFLNAMRDYNLNPTPIQIGITIITPLLDSKQFAKAFEVTMLLIQWHKREQPLVNGFTVSWVILGILSSYHRPEALNWVDALHKAIKKTDIKLEHLKILQILFEIGSPPAIELAMDVFETELTCSSRLYFHSEFHDAKAAEPAEMVWTEMIGGLLRNGHNNKARQLLKVLERSKFRPFTEHLRNLVHQAKLQAS